MNDVAGLLQQSAALVKTWGESRLPSGKTLAEALTVYGIPLWDAFVVDLARLHLPRALARGNHSRRARPPIPPRPVRSFPKCPLPRRTLDG